MAGQNNRGSYKPWDFFNIKVCEVNLPFIPESVGVLREVRGST